MNSIDIKDKRFLITHIWLAGFGGAEINVLQLARYLKSKGARVKVFTYYFDMPLIQEFKHSQIEVTSSEDLSLADFDYVWINQQILPQNMLKQLGEKQKYPPLFIFMHSSALKEHPIEWSFIPNFEDVISSHSLYVSQEALNAQTQISPHIKHASVFPNPVSSEFINHKQLPIQPNKIAIVSNHPSPELVNLYHQHKKQIVWFGIGGKYELITAKKLAEFDLVISIAKTAYYCLVGGIPFYIYDEFGGLGYLTHDNYNLAKHHNFAVYQGFSGSSLKKKTTKEIEAEIFGDKSTQLYSAAKQLLKDKKDEFINEYSFDSLVPQILHHLPPQQVMFSQKNVNHILLMLQFAKNYALQFKEINARGKAIKFLEKRDILGRIKKSFASF